MKAGPTLADGLALAALTLAAGLTPTPGGTRLAPWDPDSYDYAIRMLMRRGATFEAAREQARAFFATTAWGQDPHYAALLALDEPQWWRLFAPRRVYPALAALLYPRRGFAALVDVPRAAYVLTAPLLYCCVRDFASPGAAALATLWYVRAPLVRHVAGFALTDAPALLFWTAALGAAARIARDGRGWALFALALGLLAFTRPLTYLPFGAGVALAAFGALRRDRRAFARGTGIAALAGAATLTVMRVLARAGMPPTREHLARMRVEQGADTATGPDASQRLTRIAARFGGLDAPGRSLGAWYASTAAFATATSLWQAVRAVVPVVAVAALARERARRPVAALALGALAGSAVGILGDPAPRGTARTIVLPLYPVFAAGLGLALDAAFARVRRP